MFKPCVVHVLCLSRLSLFVFYLSAYLIVRGHTLEPLGMNKKVEMLCYSFRLYLLLLSCYILFLFFFFFLLSYTCVISAFTFRFHCIMFSWHHIARYTFFPRVIICKTLKKKGSAFKILALKFYPFLFYIDVFTSLPNYAQASLLRDT